MKEISTSLSLFGGNQTIIKRNVNKRPAEHGL